MTTRAITNANGDETPAEAAYSELAHLTVAELFAGIGLVRLALERRGWKVVFANDIDEEKFKMYRDNFSSEHFHFGDIHDLHVSKLPTCALLTASFPCNDLWGGAGLSRSRGDR